MPNADTVPALLELRNVTQLPSTLSFPFDHKLAPFSPALAASLSPKNPLSSWRASVSRLYSSPASEMRVPETLSGEKEGNVCSHCPPWPSDCPLKYLPKPPTAQQSVLVSVKKGRAEGRKGKGSQCPLPLVVCR